MLTAIFSLPGCYSVPATPASPPQRPTELEAPQPPSGFLSDYSTLKPSSKHPRSRVMEKMVLGTYRTFMIEPVRVLPETTVRGLPITPADAEELSSRAKLELVDAIRSSYAVTQAPGPGVASIRAAITHVAQSQRTASGKVQLGGAAAEVEIFDSVTHERLAAAVESDVVGPAETGANGSDKFRDAELVFEHWSARLVLWLQRLGRGESSF